MRFQPHLLSVLLLFIFFFTALSAQAQIPPVVPGFPNVTQTPGAVLSGLNAPGQGRTAIIAYHNGVLFTVPELPSSAPGSDFQVRTWDISDPTAPVETAQLGVSPMPINAHGYFKSGDYLTLGSNWPPEAPWSWRRTGVGTLERTEYPDLFFAGVRGILYQPWYVGDTYWSYGEVSGNAFIEKDWVRLSEWDHLGLTGVIGHPFLIGDLLIFASDQSRTGVATYDVSDPTNPVLLDVLTAGGAGGYWPEIWGGDGKLLIVFPYRSGGNGIRVVDATDPSDLQFVADQPLSGDAAMYMQFQDEYAFVGSHKVDMRTYQSVLDFDGANTVRPNDGGVGIDTSQFALPLGNLLVTGGIGDNQGMAIWAHQAEPDTRGPSVGYHIPQAGRTNYPLGAPITLLIHETLETYTIVNGTSFIVRPLGGDPIDGSLVFAFDDTLTFAPEEDLLPNTTYEVVLPAGGIKDAAGNGMVGYSFTFSTGSSVGGNGPPEVTGLSASAWPAAPGSNLTLTATATDPDGDTLEYRFDYGDGSPSTAWSASASATTSYAGAGHYQAVVQVRDPSGSVASRTTTVTVLTPPAGPAPTQSAQLIFDPSGRRTYTVNPDNNTVTAFNTDSLALIYEVPVCQDPRSITLTAQNELWLACHDDDRLQVLNASTGAVIDSIDLDYGGAPVGITATPNGSTVFATLQGSGELLRFSAASRSETGRVTLGSTPRAIAVSGDGSRVLVTRFLSPKNHAEVWDVNATTLAFSTMILPKIGGDDNRDGTASGRGVGNYLAGVAISPDGQSAWVTSTKANTEKGLVFFEDLDQDNTVRNMVSRFDLNTGTFAEAIDLDNSQSASAVNYSPLGDYLMITLQGNNAVVVLDALRLEQTTGMGSLVTRIGTGLAPQAIGIDPTTNRIMVKNFMDRSVTVLEGDNFFRTGDKTLPSSTVDTVQTEVLPGNVLLGKQVFYNASDPRMSGEGYISCATCHIDGGHDGRTWDFTGRGEGFRNTTTLRGRGGMDHGNVHWTANFDEIQDFENDIRGAFGGSGFMDDGDFGTTSDPLGAAKAGLSPELDALALYVASLGRESLPRSPYRGPNGALTSDGQAGRTVYQSLGCGTCHTGGEFTDSTLGTATLHDVGTLRTTSGQRLGGTLNGIDTPTLRGIWATAPYFHDGSAEELTDVFRVAGGTLIPAENGTAANGAEIVTQWVELNNDDTVHGRAMAVLDSDGQSLTLSGIDGGSGGLGALEIRHSTGSNPDLQIWVNGVLITTRALQDTGNDPSWQHTYWEQERIEDIPLNAGATNTIEFIGFGGWVNLSIDDVVVSTADDLAAAQPHRSVLALSQSDQDDLLAYLLQIDGTTAGSVGGLLSDGFESGDLSAWSRSVGN